MARVFAALFACTALHLTVAAPVNAQTPTEPTQAFSINPIGLMYGLYNFDYEVRAAPSVTIGAGASRLGGRTFGSEGSAAFTNGDAFMRYYPSGQAFSGLSLGVKAGITEFSAGDRYLGIGFDLNHSAILNDHLVYSTGLGLKRLVGDHVVVLPTFRLNVGVAF